MVIKVDFLVELNRTAIKVAEELRLINRLFLSDMVARHTLCVSQQVTNDRLRVYLLLDVNRHHGDGEAFTVLIVFSLPDQLRVERGVARVKHSLRGMFFIGHKVAQLLCGDVVARVLVAYGFDFRWCCVLLSHNYDHSVLGGSLGLGLSVR